LRNSFKALGSGNGSTNGNEEVLSQTNSDQHWKWRLKMAEHICRKMDMEKYGVVAVYLIGSTKNATAGPASDLDLMIHHRSGNHQLENLKSWLEGWSLCLAEENFQRTGYQSDGLIDLHLVTDSDIEARTSFAVMIGSVTDGARLLR
jgi:pyruvate,water dikinase